MTRLHRFHHFSDIRHAVIVSIVLIDQIHHNLRHHVFFLRAALGNHQRQGDQCIVIQKARTVSTIKNPIVFQEPKEQESGDTLVTVAERMVFNRQIEQISRLLLNARSMRLTSIKSCFARTLSTVCHVCSGMSAMQPSVSTHIR